MNFYRKYQTGVWKILLIFNVKAIAYISQYEK